MRRIQEHRARTRQQRERARVGFGQALQSAGRCCIVGGARGQVHRPVQARDIGHVGFILRALGLRDEDRQPVAPDGDIADPRRLPVPQGARQRGERFLTQQLRHRGIGRPQGPLGQGTGIRLVGLQAARLLRTVAAPAGQHAGPRVAPQRPQQHLLAQHLFLGAHDAAVIIASACAASASSTAGAGSSVSHSTSVGRGPRRASAWR